MRHYELPITFKEIDGDSDLEILYNVKFLKTFGPWDKGHASPILVLNREMRTVEERDSDGNPVRQSKYRLEAEGPYTIYPTGEKK
jgi:hypothetical protein